MNKTTIALLILSVIIAGGLSYFQYFYRAKSKSKMTKLLAFLRFLSVFGLLLLLINPIVSRSSFETIKTPLPIIVDNSSSIVDLKANEIAQDVYTKLASNSKLKDKFDVQSYSFDSEFQPSETFDFKGTQTNIDEVAKNLKSINKNLTFPTVLISDGNQTSGSDYVFSFDVNNKVYPLVVGDTTTYLDLKINQINVNKYAFHKNKFPVEVFLQYAGTKSVTANFAISQGNNVLNKQSVSFSPSNKSAVINVLLPADKTGLQIFNASLTSSESEKNTYNNSKKFAVEIIDQKTEVAIISAINHPDIGALKRGIETNAQRKVTILKPNQISDLNKYNVLVIYQPNGTYKQVFDANKNLKINTWIITGLNTDFGFLSQQQDQIDFKMSNQKEDYLTNFDSDFNLFAIDNLGFENFPPLENPFGTITPNENTSTLLSSRIRNVDTEQPLLTFFDNQGKRNAYLFGENIWKWRAHSYVDKKSFEEFDVFLDKTIQFLASNDSKKSLIVNHERFYNSGDALEITAQYFNKNYEFDEKARLTIAVTNTKSKQVKRYDLLKTNNSFKVNLDGLSAGQYSFSVKELNSNASYSSRFEILDFDIEKQFVNPDLNKLKQLASQTNGAVFVPNQVDNLIKTLLENEDYKAIQKSIVKKTPLIDWVWLLVLIAITLASEWFLRKYNGLL
ncbi:hypothetical protein [Flavobacterium aquatile]|uniref:VWA domain-containing protein n=1 Tax=Flavobacterium aquatile LMG 4008 = ATCC 11947 TaxID=1453498 RepID=A0A095TZE2_9FLAO|nr:hypothetical protein [Flavobacterium aquatile]KGD67763.1 hypothetical protein LG45_11625 [Flavobacterium aquatile LMG 4008 = ATCC 11947]OXA67624.1 hypothetical protein B0A61_07360 [Flavobacterium aquatile LMG 4008 = ATCC 11947]GEC78259.1 hypothetical protein FAQ01_11290 [Flavobacterium aquatile]